VVRNTLQRLIFAYRDGRDVSLDKILQHELMSVPLSLGTTSGTINSASKSLLAAVLIQDELIPEAVVRDSPRCLLVDGQALVMALSKKGKHFCRICTLSYRCMLYSR
jgi:hypothetical protein